MDRLLPGGTIETGVSCIETRRHLVSLRGTRRRLLSCSGTRRRLVTRVGRGDALSSHVGRGNASFPVRDKVTPPVAARTARAPLPPVGRLPAVAARIARG
ncbi:hypothetical protein BHE74_00029617 [Ensete ventricosum]|nr:hypothetical protein GW17_00007637 [Ensete ventricosum]RWW63208.1 hypothetical protein BHE74_00029617 [Ensete ventricosum]